MPSQQPQLELYDPEGSLTHRPYRRIVAVQGAVQLVSAIAAMRSSVSHHSAIRSENHLIVHDLSCPGDQGADFANCISQLAKQAESWASVHYFPLPEMLRLQDALKKGSWELAIRTMHERLDLQECDELLLGQNLLYINNLLSRSYATALKACYGDGIGLNFSADYYTPFQEKPSRLRVLGRWIERTVRHRVKAWRGISPSQTITTIPKKSRKHQVTFDKHYLLLANQFDQCLDSYVQLSPKVFEQLFALFADQLSPAANQTCTEIAAAVRRAPQIVVLLTSNFSETKRMTLAGEVKSCLEMVRHKQKEQQALLIIKPHPRDSIDKIRVIRDQAHEHFRKVITLDEPWSFYLPFESIYVRLIGYDPHIVARTSVVCSSSACVSLEYLYGQPCDIGFGSRVVRRYFNANWQPLRLKHEADLKSLTHHVRRLRRKMEAA